MSAKGDMATGQKARHGGIYDEGAAGHVHLAPGAGWRTGSRGCGIACSPRRHLLAHLLRCPNVRLYVVMTFTNLIKEPRMEPFYTVYDNRPTKWAEGYILHDDFQEDPRNGLGHVRGGRDADR